MDFNQGFVNLDCNLQNRFVRFDESNEMDSLDTLVKSRYNSGTNLPCDGINIECQGLSQCELILFYRFNNNTKPSLDDYGNGICFYADVDDLALYRCINIVGECANSPTANPTLLPTRMPTTITQSPTPGPTNSPTPSPTLAPSDSPTPSPTPAPLPSPTNAPTFVPTNAPTPSPTDAPTPAPTNSPTPAPTFSPLPSPTNSPTNSPTPAPTLSPTPSPTPAPTNSPTFSPTPAPTSLPTEQPTLNPSITPTQTTNIPTKAPTMEPTVEPTKTTNVPTQTPTVEPTSSPTYSPTISPTPGPTKSPTPAPTTSPTGSPTPVPTESPTNSPTRFPTDSNLFFGFINPTFVIANISDDILFEMYNINNIDRYLNTFNFIFEKAIFDSIIQRYNEENLRYNDFNANIQEFNDHKVTDKKLITYIPRDNTVRMKTNVTCNRNTDSFTCILIVQILRSNTQTFINFANAELNEKLNDNGMYLYVDNPQALTVEEWEPEPETYTFIIVMAIFGSIILLLALLAFLYNAGCCKRCSESCHETDNAQWLSLLKWGFQCYDFFSDIYFTYNIFLDRQSYINTINGYQSGEIERINEPLEVYQRDALISLILGVGSVMFTLGPYILNLYFAANIKLNPIIKANKNALDYFNNGASLFIILTVLSGGVYASLTVISSMIFGLYYFNTGLTKYEMNKLTKMKLISTIICENLPQLLLQLLYFVQFGFESSNGRDAALLAFVGSILSVVLSVLVWYVNRKEQGILPVIYYIEFGKKRRVKLTETEKTLFSTKTFIRQKLISKITKDVYNVSPTVLQISYINVIDCGVLIRVVHFVDNNDLLTMQRSLRNDTFDTKSKHSNKFDEYHDMFTGLNPKFYTYRLFKQHKRYMLTMCFNFFNLDSITSSHHFEIKYHDEIPTYIDTKNNNPSTLNVLNNAIQMAQLNSVSDTDNHASNAVIVKLKEEIKLLKLEVQQNDLQRKKFLKFVKDMYPSDLNQTIHKRSFSNNNTNDVTNDNTNDVVKDGINDTQTTQLTQNEEIKYDNDSDSDDLPPRGNIGQILGAQPNNLEANKSNLL